MMLRSVVLPDDVPPETRTLSRLRTAASRKSIMSAVADPIASKSEGRSFSRESERRQDHIDSGAVAKPRIAHRRTLVDAAAHSAYDSIDHLSKLRVALENNRAEHHAPASLHKHLARVIDHDL